MALLNYIITGYMHKLSSIILIFLTLTFVYADELFDDLMMDRVAEDPIFL